MRCPNCKSSYWTARPDLPDPIPPVPEISNRWVCYTPGCAIVIYDHGERHLFPLCFPDYNQPNCEFCDQPCGELIELHNYYVCQNCYLKCSECGKPHELDAGGKLAGSYYTGGGKNYSGCYCSRCYQLFHSYDAHNPRPEYESFEHRINVYIRCSPDMLDGFPDKYKYALGNTH